MDNCLTLSFYLHDDIHHVSRSLIGKKIFTQDSFGITSGIIVETESYAGINDKACHAYGNRRTKRTEPMFQQGGIAYVYLCYGIHHLLNVVTDKEDIPTAVLIRAIEPIDGIDLMLHRRRKEKLDKSLTAGPGALTQALGIDNTHNNQSFLSKNLWIEEGIKIKEDAIISSPRVGVSYAGEDALLPYRFRLKNSLWTSNPK